MKPFHLICALLLCCPLLLTPVAAGAGEVGIFLRDHADCVLQRSQGSSSCRADALITAGDLIKTKNSPDALAIQWLAPEYTRLVPAGSGQYSVSFTPPKSQNGLLAIAADLVGFARRAGRVSHSAVTRSALQPPLLPGDGATLLPGRPVTLSWCAYGVRKIVVGTEPGAKVAEVPVPEGARSVSVTPEQLGLVPGVVYRWTAGRALGEGGTIKLLGPEEAETLARALLQIEQGEGSPADQTLKKLAYLRFVSEHYPERFQLGWLSYDLAEQLGPRLPAADRGAALRLGAASVSRFCE